MGSCMIFGLLYDIWATVRYVCYCMECGLLFRMVAVYGVRAVVWNVDCCMVCGLFYDMWAFVWYVGYCMLYGLLNGMWADVWYVVCCMVCGLVYMWYVA